MATNFELRFKDSNSSLMLQTAMVDGTTTELYKFYQYIIV